MQSLLNWFKREPKPVFYPNAAIEMRARRMLREKGWHLPSQSYDLERTLFWHNESLSIADYRPDGKAPGVMIIHALIDKKLKLVYLSGDSRNAFYLPGRWEQQLTFFAAHL